MNQAKRNRLRAAWHYMNQRQTTRIETRMIRAMAFRDRVRTQVGAVK